MKVLLIAENWPPRMGGIENYLTNVAKSLAPISLTVIAPESPEKVSDTSFPNVSVIRRRFFWSFLKPAWLPLYLSLKNLVKRDRPDVVFCGKALFEGLPALWLKKKFGIPYVIFTYAMEIEVWAQTEQKKLETVLQNADRVVYINEITKKSLLRFGVTEKQLVKIWPGVDDRCFDEVGADVQASVLKKYGITQPYIFTLSRLIPRKGTDLLIEAMRQGSVKAQLVVAGGGPEREKLERQTKELGIADKVRFLGVVPDEDLPALFSGATLFALTPRNDAKDMEGFGIVYMEAAARGVPAIGTLVGGVPEAVLHNQTGLLVQPDNPGAIAEVIELLFKDEAKRTQLGETAKKRAYDEFRWSKRILLVKSVIDAILTSKT
jgi:phosphatidyl-myo-inositol dimannoside synthase